MCKIWGKKVMKSKESCLDNVNTRLMVTNIQEGVENYLENFMFEKPEVVHESGVMKTTLDDYMQNLEDRKAIQSGKSYTHVYLNTWKMLYPKLYKRVLAKFGRFLVNKLHLFKLEEKEPHIWQYIFPYKIKMYVDDHEWKLKSDWYKYKNPSDQEDDESWDDIEDFWDFENVDMAWYVIWLENNSPEVVYKAELRIPYTYLNVELYIQPIRALEKIELTFNIERE